ncbi:tyrosine-type recombinase/integrase [Empedobacter brevis]|uniref:tyrosine-type recombinase/integrase n=1 Tax=Empedobacter brevis TaxID=247 RepID=UPI0023F2CF5B|nr:site-specific integrase [Empedobacter brevis]
MGLNFQEIAKKWFDGKKRLIKPSSVSAYHTIVFAGLLPYFSEKEINNQTVQQYVIDCTFKKKYSKRTVQDHIKILTYILKEGENNGLCKAQVFDVELPSILDMRKRESRAFSISDIKKLRSYLIDNSVDNIYNFAILLSLSLGLRIGEVTGLKFSDFDFRNKMVHISRTSQRIINYDELTGLYRKTLVNIGTTKTKSSNRKVPISETLLNLVEIYLEGKSSDDFIFKGKFTKMPMDNRLLRERYYGVLEKLNLPKITFHGLRHSFASNCIASNIDIKTTSAMLGHSDIKMTLEIYTHPSFEQKKAAVNKLGKLLS